MFSKFLSEGVKVSFDFDDTLQFLGSDGAIPREKYIELFKQHIKNKDTVIIVTTRNNEKALEVKLFLRKNELPDVPIFTTNGESKFQTLKDKEVNVHYDDDGELLDELKGIGVTGVSSVDSDLITLYSDHWDIDIKDELRD